MKVLLLRGMTPSTFRTTRDVGGNTKATDTPNKTARARENMLFEKTGNVEALGWLRRGEEKPGLSRMGQLGSAMFGSRILNEIRKTRCS
jgi:hypothetical protein